MGQQKGALKLTGTHGNFTFVKTKDGFVWKEKSEIEKERFLTDKAFKPQRDNGIEFGRAGKAVKLVRKAFSDQIDPIKDRMLTPRMQKQMLLVVKSDPTHRRGERLVELGNLSLMEQFPINGNAGLEKSLKAEYTASIDRVSGKVVLEVPPFIPVNCLEKPVSSTHFRLVCAGSEIDFAGHKSNTVSMETDLFPIDGLPTAAITLTGQLTPGSTLPIFLAVGIRFSEVVNGFEDPVIGGEHNAMDLVKIDTV